MTTSIYRLCKKAITQNLKIAIFAEIINAQLHQKVPQTLLKIEFISFFKFVTCLDITFILIL